MKKRAHREGTLQSFRFNSGMHLHIADFKPSETIVERFGSGDPAFRFYFNILASGHWELKSPYRSISQSKLIRSNGFGSVIFYPEMEDASVTEAALSVGYDSISSFSKAFSEYFGMRPMACRKKKIINV